MKRWLLILLSFGAGLVVASVAWGWQLFNLQLDYAAGVGTSLQAQAGAGAQMLRFLDDPQLENAPRLAFAASNMVSGFLVGLDMCEERWPYLHIRDRHTSEYDRIQQFLQTRQARFALMPNGEPDSAANPIPPITTPEAPADQPQDSLTAPGSSGGR